MVKLPIRRVEMIEHLEMLSNKDLQIKSWIKHEYPEGVEYDTLMFAVEFFDDMYLADKSSYKQIGYILKDENELLVIQRLTTAIDEVFEAVGKSRSDALYLNHPLWDNVIQAAKDAFELIRE